MKRFLGREDRRSFSQIQVISFNGHIYFSRWVFFILVSIIFAGLPAGALAKQGDLDQTFGSGGKLLTDFAAGDDLANSLALQPDGKIIAVGRSGQYPDFHSALARYNADGSLDQTFGTGGRAVITLNVNGDRLISAVILPDGKILAAGSVFQNNLDLSFLVVRFNADGSLDQTFGTAGMANVVFGDDTAEVSKILVQPDGKIVVAGTSGRGQGNDMNDFALARFNSDGGIDKSFGVGGKLKTHFSGANSGTRAGSAVLQPDGKIVVAGSYKNEGMTRQFALARYNPDGSLDQSFGAGGTLSTDFGKDTHGQAIALQPDGKIVVGGYYETGFFRANEFALARYDSHGNLDPTFGAGGKVVKDLAGNDIIYAVLIQRDGKIVAVGRSGQVVSFRFAVVRFNSNGEFDNTFGDGGKAITDIDGTPAEAFAGALQSNGRIVVAGYSGAFQARDFTLVRYAAFSQAKQFDFDKDAKADVSVYRNGTWYLNSSTSGISIVQFGLASDKIVPADYDGDGEMDIAVFRPSDGNWYSLNSSDGTFSVFHFGMSGDIPMAGDYDADGRADQAVYRGGTWYIQRSTEGFTAAQFGVQTDRPVAADYDGDGRTDIAVYRDGTWYIYGSLQGVSIQQFGAAEDRTVVADYDQDGKADLAVWRPSEGIWYVFQSSTASTRTFVLGFPSDLPVPGDYDGDGKTDFAIYRGSGTWWIWQSGSNAYMTQNFGLAGDTPVPSAYIY
jgi:uncharacterized delta-60 repeat protein